MMNSRNLFPVLAAAVSLLLPTSVLAAPATFFGPIVPEICRSCPCGFGGVMQIIQNVMNLGIAISILVAVAIMVWGGILFIVSATNPESRSTANKMLINAAVGLCIVLSSWLIVDFVMKTLYGGTFGPWNTILTETGTDCLVAKPTKPLFEGDILAIPGQGTVVDDTPAGGGSNCPVPDPSSMAKFPSAVVQGGTGLATQQTVNNFMAMREAALKDGVDLRVTSSYRSEASQVSLWNQYCSSGTCGSMKVGKPCSMGGNGSNHNSGQALDISVGCRNGNAACDTKAYKWLKANGSKWNFRNDLPSDPVHWSPSGR